MINKNDVKEKDLRRIRNLYEGKLNVKTNVQIGYQKQQQLHKEGDIWEENEKKWTIRNGIKQTISNLDSIKKDILMPFICPSCSKPMKKRLDKKFYNIHKRCFNCVVEAENDIRKQGLWNVYEKNIMKSNVLDVLQDFKDELYDVIESTNSSFVTEGGEVESWVGGLDKDKNKERVDTFIETMIDKINNEQ
jgi:hypothetical protein